MKEKVVLDKEYYEFLKKTSDKEGLRKIALRLTAHLREALNYGLLIPKDDSALAREKIDNALNMFKATIDVFDENLSDNPLYSATSKNKEEQKESTSLRLVR